MAQDAVMPNLMGAKQWLPSAPFHRHLLSRLPLPTRRTTGLAGHRSLPLLQKRNHKRRKVLSLEGTKFKFVTDLG